MRRDPMRPLQRIPLVRSSLAHDLYDGALSDLRSPVLSAARNVVDCNLSPGPGDFSLVSAIAGNRYYLLTSVGSSSLEYGIDSFGKERPASTTVPGCR